MGMLRTEVLPPTFCPRRQELPEIGGKNCARFELLRLSKPRVVSCYVCEVFPFGDHDKQRDDDRVQFGFPVFCNLNSVKFVTRIFL
jgi:hypothetical protein